MAGVSRKIVHMMITVTYDGDYYDATEVEDVTSDWISMGFEDRDNLTGWSLIGATVTEMETPSE